MDTGITLITCSNADGRGQRFYSDSPASIWSTDVGGSAFRSGADLGRMVEQSGD